MTPKNPYAWMAGLAAAHFQAEQAKSKKPHLTLITPDQTPPKGRKPKMSKPIARDAKKSEMTAMIKEAFADAAPTPTGPVYRKLSQLRLADHVSMVHNALEAVRCLAIPSHGTGISPDGLLDDMANIGRNHFVDLLEIINDRLGTALELDGNGPC